MGCAILPGQVIDDVLLLFDDDNATLPSRHRGNVAFRTSMRPTNSTKRVFQRSAHKIAGEPMTTSATKSPTASPTAAQSAHAPLFNKAGGGDFFAPSKAAAAPTIQTKLAVSEPCDKLEREADAMAGKVMRMPAPAPGQEEKLSRQPDDKLKRAADDKVQKVADDKSVRAMRRACRAAYLPIAASTAHKANC